MSLCNSSPKFKILLYNIRNSSEVRKKIKKLESPPWERAALCCVLCGLRQPSSIPDEDTFHYVYLTTSLEWPSYLRDTAMDSYAIVEKTFKQFQVGIKEVEIIFKSRNRFSGSPKSHHWGQKKKHLQICVLFPICKLRA